MTIVVIAERLLTKRYLSTAVQPLLQMHWNNLAINIMTPRRMTIAGMSATVMIRVN